MPVQHFSSLAGLEMVEKFVGGGVVEHVTTVSNSNASCFRVVLSWVKLRWVLTKVMNFMTLAFHTVFTKS